MKVFTPKKAKRILFAKTFYTNNIEQKVWLTFVYIRIKTTAFTYFSSDTKLTGRNIRPVVTQ